MLNIIPRNLARCVGLLVPLAALYGHVLAAAPTPSPSAAMADPEQRYFDVHEYRVLGNSVLPNREIETVLYPLLGDHKSLSDVETARAALEKEYHDRGYATVFVDIPEQDVGDKIVRLKVTEGRLNEVRISGARYFSERKILAAVPEATPGVVPNLPVLQAELSAVSVQSADRNVVPILKAGPLPGTVDLAFKVDDHLPFHGSLEFDNQYTPSTRPLRATGGLSYGDLFQDLDSLAIQYQVAPQDVGQVSVFAANYAFGPFANGLHASVSFIDSNSNVPAVSTLGVLGKGQIFSTRFAYFLNDSTSAPSLTLGVDYKHFDQTINLASGSSSATPIHYVNLSVAFAGIWNSDWLTDSATASVNFGPRGLPNSPSEFAAKCFRCQPNYYYFKAGGSLVAHLPEGIQLIVRADGQFATEPLITNEEFTITGADAVRGYLEAEVLTDKGVKGGAQLQSPIFKLRTIGVADLFAFYDAGRANYIAPLPNQPTSWVLSSWGAGVHILPSYWINGILTWADPLRSGPTTRRGESRLLFLVRGSF